MPLLSPSALISELESWRCNRMSLSCSGIDSVRRPANPEQRFSLAISIVQLGSVVSLLDSVLPDQGWQFG
jgi:hypothetical protein